MDSGPIGPERTRPLPTPRGWWMWTTTWSRGILTGLGVVMVVVVMFSVIGTGELASALPALGVGVLVLLVMPESVATRDSDLTHVVAGSVDPRTGRTSKSTSARPGPSAASGLVVDGVSGPVVDRVSGLVVATARSTRSGS